MRGQFKQPKMVIGLLLVGLLTLSFNVGNTLALTAQSKSMISGPYVPLSPFPTTSGRLIRPM